MRSQTTRTIGGSINGAGAVGNGSGFSSRRVGLGQYVISFPPGFRLAGAVASGYNFVTSQVNASAPPDTNSIIVATSTPNTGAAVDGGFWFLAWGMGV